MTGMKLTFVNVGYGEAILVEVPDARCRDGMFTMAIDGGSGEAAEYIPADTGRVPFGTYLRQSGIWHLDLIVATHIHEDHICGLTEPAGQYRPRAFWQTLPVGFHRRMRRLDETEAVTPSDAKFIRALNDYRTLCTDLEGRTRRIGAGQVMEPAPGLIIRALAPDAQSASELCGRMEAIYSADSTAARRSACRTADAEMNNRSLVLLLEYAGRRILLPGDTNRAGYGTLQVPSADVFKVGHHGQKDGISRALFRAIHPAHVVCCASSDRRYDSAHPDILRMMREEGAELHFSDCPSVPEGIPAPEPHRALTFEITGDSRANPGKLSVHYAHADAFVV